MKLCKGLDKGDAWTWWCHARGVNAVTTHYPNRLRSSTDYRDRVEEDGPYCGKCTQALERLQVLETSRMLRSSRDWYTLTVRPLTEDD